MRMSQLFAYLLAALLVGLVAEAGTAQHNAPRAHARVNNQKSKWERLSVQGFSILMPGRASLSKAAIDSPMGRAPLYTYAVENSTEAFMVSYAEFPPSKWDFNGAGLNGLSKGYLRMGGEILTERNIKLSGYPGKEATFTDSNGLFYKSKAYEVIPRLYQVIYVNKVSRSVSLEAERFFKSFTLEELFANAQREERIEVDSKKLVDTLSPDFPFLARPVLELLSKEILRRQLNPEQAGQLGRSLMTEGVSKLPDSERDELEQLGVKMQSAYTEDEINIYNSLRKKASTQSLTKEETDYSRLLIKKGYDSLTPNDQLRYRFLTERAIKIAISIQ